MVKYDHPHSYVFPADYNWLKPQQNTEMSTSVSQVNFPVSSTGNTNLIRFIKLY